jgi:hypothetical protein
VTAGGRKFRHPGGRKLRDKPLVGVTPASIARQDH